MKSKISTLLKQDSIGLLFVLALLIAFFGANSNYFFTPLTFATMANQLPPLLVIAVGMTFVLIIAGIDLSVGSLMALSGAVLGVALVNWQIPMPVAVVMCLATGLACGLLNGAIITRWGVPSFIVTLGMLEVARGGAYLTTSSETLYIGSTIEWVSAPIAHLGLSPAFVIAIVVVAIAQLLLSRTVHGRYAIAVGTNEEVAHLSGINVTRIKLVVFGAAGLLAGLGGLFHVGHLQSADPNAGIGLELSAIAAVVIGGTSLAGGKGSVFNTLLGVLIIMVLQTGLAQIGASEPSKRVITGAVIIVAVIIDVHRNRSGGIGNYFHKLLRRGQ